VLLTSFRDTDVRKKTLARTKDNHQDVEAKLLSPGIRIELYKGIAACLQERAAVLLVRILKAAEAKEAWACKLILDLAGIPQALQAVLGAAEASAPEDELLSAMEHSLVKNLLTLMRGLNGESAKPDSREE
jgi:hypothetical protein